MEILKLIDNHNHPNKFFNLIDKFLFIKRIMAKISDIPKQENNEEPTELPNLYRRKFINDRYPISSKDSNYNPMDRKGKPFWRKDQEKVSSLSSHSSNFQLISEENEEFSSITNNNNNISNHHFSRKKLDYDEYYLLGFLDLIIGLVIKSIGFQFNLFTSFFTFPIWFTYYSFMFVIDPFRFFKWIFRSITMKILNLGNGIIPFLFERITGQKSIGKLMVRFGWGIFWSIYVCFVLFGILLSGFIIGGIAMRCIVEEPIKTTETLNFDYTKSTPVAFVPVLGCPSSLCDGVNCNEKSEVGKYLVGSKIIPHYHNLEVTVSLTMPESDYNRNLGIFQVRVESLAANGKVTTSSSYPCMMRFKSQYVRFIETIINSLPLLAGYSSETQILDLKMRGLNNEEEEPISCLKVILEQRAEYKPSAGIPEIYAASVVLESALPLYRKIIWNWRKTLFVWTSLVSFMVELVFILICCRPVILPRTRPRVATDLANKIAAGKTIPLIKGS